MEGKPIEKKVSLKLMVDKKANKVAFAEAGQEFVDYISLIMSSVMSLPHGKAMGYSFGTLRKLIDSIEGANSASSPGQVKDGVTYMVTDNMEVQPMKAALIKPYVGRFKFLEEKIVDVGPYEALAILTASFKTNGVLTTVFLENKFKCFKLCPSLSFRTMLFVVFVLSYIGTMLFVVLVLSIIGSMADGHAGRMR